MTGMAALPAGAPPDDARRLDGAIAADSSICLLSAADNRLAYRGYDVAELARRATYEETAFLLLQGRLPDRAALREFTQKPGNVRMFGDKAHVYVPRDLFP